MTQKEIEKCRSVRGIDYLLEQLEIGGTVIKAIKKSKVIAKKGNVGDVVISWVVGTNGEEIKEKENVVTLDPTTNEPDWIVTKVDELGNPIIDKNGHLNQWIVSDSKFRKKYEIDPDNSMLYKSISNLNEFIKLEEDIYLIDNDMFIKAGGYLNITDLESIYGISEKDFLDTYSICSEHVIKAR